MSGILFKSSWRAVLRSVFLSRERWADKYRELKAQRDDSQATIQQLRSELESKTLELRELQRQVKEQERTSAVAGGRLPVDPRLPQHGYGAKLIALAVNLARVAGLRGAEQCLKLCFEYLELKMDVAVPCWTTIRTWMQRLGVAALQEDLPRAEDWVWMADHSNQIGQEKVLVVLGIRASEMPPPGEAIRHEQMQVLTVKPGIAWKQADVARVYQELARKYGKPRAVVSDGAVELQAAARSLDAQVLVVEDFKHKVANQFKSLIEKAPRFKSFLSKSAHTRSKIQQTELGHLTPPAQKAKSRFMNLDEILRWGQMILWLLNNPAAESRKLVTTERLNSHLGWVRNYAEDLAAWSECQEVINGGVTVINQQGLFPGVSAQLRAALPAEFKHSLGRQLADRVVEFVLASESQLQQDERLPFSTEILESSFGLYKQLERQHSKGGFTTLLASFGALLKKATPDSVRRSLCRVSVKQMREWTRENIGVTVRTKRKTTYQEHKAKTKCATDLNITT